MLRQIITSSEPVLTLKLPVEMVDKTVEVIAFEIDIAGTEKQMDKSERINHIKSITEKSLVDLSNFKFDRDDANNYDE